MNPIYRCNFWHIWGRDRDMLVDSGIGVLSLREWVQLMTERPLDAVASHTHFDHIGTHHDFPCRLCHAAEADILADPTRANPFAADYVTAGIFTTLPPPPYASATYTAKSAPATRILHDHDIIDLGDRAFEVIHAPGGIALWEKTTGLLISGDIVYDGSLIESNDPVDMQQYAASKKRRLALPVKTVHGGHFPSYDGARHRQLITDWLCAKDV